MEDPGWRMVDGGWRDAVSPSNSSGVWFDNPVVLGTRNVAVVSSFTFIRTSLAKRGCVKRSRVKDGVDYRLIMARNAGIAPLNSIPGALFASHAENDG